MPALVGVILAGGRATRMGGGDKGLRLIAGRPLLTHVIDRLAPQVGAMVLSANGPHETYAQFGLPVVADSPPLQAGPLAGMLAGLDWAAAQGSSTMVSVAVDTPFFPRDLVARLQAAAGPGGVAIAATRHGQAVRRHPTFGLWPVALRDDLRRALAGGARKLGDWAAQHAPGLAIFDSDGPDPFFNINTPEDLALAEQRATSRP